MVCDEPACPLSLTRPPVSQEFCRTGPGWEAPSPWSPHAQVCRSQGQTDPCVLSSRLEPRPPQDHLTRTGRSRVTQARIIPFLLLFAPGKIPAGPTQRKRRTKSRTDSARLRIKNAGRTQRQLPAWAPFSRRHPPRTPTIRYRGWSRLRRGGLGGDTPRPPGRAWEFGARLPSGQLRERPRLPRGRGRGLERRPTSPNPRPGPAAKPPRSPQRQTTAAGDDAPAGNPCPAPPAGRLHLPPRPRGARARRPSLDTSAAAQAVSTPTRENTYT